MKRFETDCLSDVERDLLEVWQYVNDSLGTLEEVSDLIVQVYAAVKSGNDKQAFALLKKAIGRF